MPPPHHEPRTTTTTLDSTSTISPHNSSTPLITSAQRQDLRTAGEESARSGEKSPKLRKRSLFGLGKKKDEKQAANKSDMDAPTSAPAVGVKQQQSDLKAKPQPIPLSPQRHPLPSAIAASPSRMRSSSPRLHSPASSEIFERNVQEPIPISTLGNELTPAHIPTHVMTEDSIPPALEASAQAITSENLNPDEVEIVMSASHQPAAATVLEGSASHADLTQLNSPIAPPTLQHQKSEDSEQTSSLYASGLVTGVEDDAASNYGQLDPNDVRRLSFISFKDIVQSEHNQQLAASFGDVGSRDSMHMANLPPNILQLQDGNRRAASPLRSPRSPASTHSQSLSGGLATPPPGVNIDSAATHGEQSPVRSIGLGSPPSQHGELTIETMRQALRKTASGDLSNVRSAGMSPIASGEDLPMKDPPRSRTNT